LKTTWLLTRQKSLWRAVALLTALALFLLLSAILVQSQEVPPATDGGEVQILTGSLERGTEAFYFLPRLKEGDMLYVYATGGAAGNLDPFVGLSATPYTADELQTSISADVGQMREQGRDTLEFLPAIYSSYFVAWDDDSGPGYDAVFEYAVPADGDYQLMVSNSPPARSFGDYRVLVGLGAEEVLTGDAEPTDADIAFFDAAANRTKILVQEITGTLTNLQRHRSFV
jgi:hypothetical protein